MSTPRNITLIKTGEEFETNKFIDGKRVYGKRINCGTLPANGSTSETPTGLENVIYTNLEGGFIANNKEWIPVNLWFNDNLRIGTFIQNNNIKISNQQGNSQRTGIVYVTVYYTKE